MVLVEPGQYALEQQRVRTVVGTGSDQAAVDKTFKDVCEEEIRAGARWPIPVAQ